MREGGGREGGRNQLISIGKQKGGTWILLQMLLKFLQIQKAHGVRTKSQSYWCLS